MRRGHCGRKRQHATRLGRPPRLSFVLLALLSPCVASAQTNDVYFRSWRWIDNSGGAQANALAGTTAALKDDLAGLEANPATLATLSRSALSFSFAASRGTRTSIGDLVRPRSSLDDVSAAFKLGAHLGVAVFRSEPLARRIELAPLTASDGTRDEGTISAVSTDLGMALARSFGSHLALGATLTHCHLAFSAHYSRLTPPLPAVFEVGAAGGADRFTPSFGALLSLSRRVQLGLSHRVGVRWQVQRVSISPLWSLTLDSGTPLRVVRPATTSLGAHISLSRRLTFSTQLDYLTFASAAPGVLEGYRSLDVPRQEWEPHAAIELALPTRSFSVLLRTGVRWMPRPARTEALTPPTPLLPGVAAWAPPPPASLFQRDVEQAVVHRLDSRGSFGAGLALVTRAGLRLDLALRAGAERPALLAGTSWRF
jgi:hypothetical protein